MAKVICSRTWSNASVRATWPRIEVSSIVDRQNVGNVLHKIHTQEIKPKVIVRTLIAWKFSMPGRARVARKWRSANCRILSNMSIVDKPIGYWAIGPTHAIPRISNKSVWMPNAGENSWNVRRKCTKLPNLPNIHTTHEWMNRTRFAATANASRFKSTENEN